MYIFDSFRSCHSTSFVGTEHYNGYMYMKRITHVDVAYAWLYAFIFGFLLNFSL